MTDRAKAIAAILAIVKKEPRKMGGGVFRGTDLSEWQAGVIADAVLAVVVADLRRLYGEADWPQCLMLERLADAVERGDHVKGRDL